MDVELLESEKHLLKVKLKGEDLGFASLVVEKLLAEKTVSFASAAFDHPLKGNPVITVKAPDAKKQLVKALDAVADDLAELRGALKKAK